MTVYPNASTGAAGYTCGCGMWVAYGAVHTCGTARNWQNPPQPPVDPTLARIASALERIATELEGGRPRGGAA